ncbi:hypothetical protein NQ317_010682 [Molorchus minor]|uniref:Mif2/CENP-C cupin domain-containing protein n=1 Tax=Molorchus minor TaxID=1323400 RepID=A0ABQ9K8R3_9CUCU|nr:hypothetical protein NQ317_010682 [Molorchus minor]
MFNPRKKLMLRQVLKKLGLKLVQLNKISAPPSSDNQPEEVNFKVPKKRGRKPKKQIDMENDDGVSSTTVESHEVTGVRRSTRERRPLESSSKPRTKKNSNKTVRDKSPVKKGRGRKKVQKNQEQKTETEAAREKEVNPVANTMDREENTPLITDVPKTIRKRHNNDRLQTSSDEISEEVPVKNKKTSGSNTPALRKSSPQKNHNTNEVSSSTEHQINFSANADVGNNDIPDEGIENFKRMDTNINDMNSNEVVTNAGCQNNSVDGEYPDEYEYRDSGDVFPKRQTETTSNLEGHIQTQFIKPPDKDSGRSTMLKSTTFEDSHQKPSKTLTGRIAKKYKKKENFDTKISKVLSRSINQSREVELLNGKDPKLVDMSHKEERLLRRSSILQTKPANGEFINLLTHDDVVSIKYVEKTHAYKEVGDSLMVTDVLKNGFYFICEGEGLIQVHNKTAKVGKMDHFIVPLGVEYSINNLSKDDCLVLGFVVYIIFLSVSTKYIKIFFC